MIYFLSIACGLLLCAVWFSKMSSLDSSYLDSAGRILKHVFIWIAIVVLEFGAISTESIVLFSAFTILLAGEVLACVSSKH